ncbi:hypothetical protein [Clostridium sp. Cult1]|uniref:hypothetical protein n=1 Tax=Clostridium sp. Cult1 TaxID=2079002 RepID=UPI001F3D2F01|nr:hypothetical protein [Clostridium sp. Cult1]MCF6462453.1 hypothetical protein [Clostridium sp. Cult1]
MEKRILIFIMILFILSIYTVAFSYDGIEKSHIDIPEIDQSKGEIFVYGSILRLDYERNEIIIEQHMDDNSVKVNPILKIREDAVFILQRNRKKMNIDFEDLKTGDRFGIVLDNNGLVRGVIISV